MAKHGQEKRGRHRPIVFEIVAALIVLLSIAGAVIVLRPEPPALTTEVIANGAALPLGATRLPRRETRPTVDPARFTGMAAAAYQVARDVPDVLDQLHCYCACGSDYGHVSLLSCYVDGHGST
jgi:hypothetical protein